MTNEPVFQDTSEEEINHKIRIYNSRDLDLEKETAESRAPFTSEKGEGTEKLTAEELFPRFHQDLSVYRIKDINRLITRKISPKVKEDLIEERNFLVRKKFGDGLSNKEERRLIYVRWQLDRFDDAESGEILDYLEDVADEHEKFAKDISTLLNQLKI